MMAALLALGPFIFEILPLTLQRIEGEFSIDWAAKKRFGAGVARQFTGSGDATRRIEGLIFNEEFGGYGEYLAMAEFAKLGEPVEMVGWSTGFGLVMGPVCILKVSDTHEHIAADGIGRKVTFSIEVGSLGGGAAGGLF